MRAAQEIGPSQIIERIGTGGLGDAYRAEQRGAVEREVGMDTRDVLARFDADARALLRRADVSREKGGR